MTCTLIEQPSRSFIIWITLNIFWRYRSTTTFIPVERTLLVNFPIKISLNWKLLDATWSIFLQIWLVGFSKNLWLTLSPSLDRWDPSLEGLLLVLKFSKVVAWHHYYFIYSYHYHIKENEQHLPDTPSNQVILLN